jgi:hypothetical protein
MLRPTALFLVAVFCAVAAAGAQKEQSFPHAKKNGRATVEYRHEGLTVVVNYDFSQNDHKGFWLLIDVAMASTKRFVLHRDNFTLVTPEGRTVKLATQEALIADSAGITSLLQNSKPQRRQLDSYFNQRDTREHMNFYSIPGVRTVSNEAIVDNDRVTIGELLFRSPEGRWQEGTHRLAIDNEKGKAALPITLN